MADIAGLFQTPEQYQLAQRQAQDAQAIQYANLDPRAKADYGFYSAGQQLGGAIGGALGGQDPQLQLISLRNAVMQDVDPNNPVSLQTAIQKLSKGGDQIGAMQLTDYLRKAQSDYALIQQRTAEKLTPEVLKVVDLKAHIKTLLRLVH